MSILNENETAEAMLTSSPMPESAYRPSSMVSASQPLEESPRMQLQPVNPGNALPDRNTVISESLS